MGNNLSTLRIICMLIAQHSKTFAIATTFWYNDTLLCNDTISGHLNEGEIDIYEFKPTGDIYFDGCQSDFDTVLKVYTFNDSENPIKYNDDFTFVCDQHESFLNLAFDPSYDDLYYLEVSGNSGYASSGMYSIKYGCHSHHTLLKCGDMRSGDLSKGELLPFEFEAIPGGYIDACSSDFDTVFEIYEYESESYVNRVYNSFECTGRQSFLLIDDLLENWINMEPSDNTTDDRDLHFYLDLSGYDTVNSHGHYTLKYECNNDTFDDDFPLLSCNDTISGYIDKGRWSGFEFKPSGEVYFDGCSSDLDLSLKVTTTNFLPISTSNDPNYCQSSGSFLTFSSDPNYNNSYYFIVQSKDGLDYGNYSFTYFCNSQEIANGKQTNDGFPIYYIIIAVGFSLSLFVVIILIVNYQQETGKNIFDITQTPKSQIQSRPTSPTENEVNEFEEEVKREPEREPSLQFAPTPSNDNEVFQQQHDLNQEDSDDEYLEIIAMDIINTLELSKGTESSHELSTAL